MPSKKLNLVLVGAGHSHLFVLQRLGQDPIFAQAVKVIVFAPHDSQLYSGMIPGWLSGRYFLEQCSISLNHQIQHLRANGVDIDWCSRSIIKIEALTKILLDDCGEEHRADIISVDVGSQSRALQIQDNKAQAAQERAAQEQAAQEQAAQEQAAIVEKGFKKRFTKNVEQRSEENSAARLRKAADKLSHTHQLSELSANSLDDCQPSGPQLSRPVIAVKPISQLCQQVNQLIHDDNKRPHAVLVMGSGAAAVELVASLKDRLPTCHFALQVKNTLLPGFPKGVTKRVHQRLSQLGIDVYDQSFSRAQIHQVTDSNSTTLQVINATGVVSPSNICFSDFDKDEQGFLLVNQYHQCLGHQNIFAVGDICSRPGTCLQRSGVHAVRVGPILAENLRQLALWHGKQLMDSGAGSHLAATAIRTTNRPMSQSRSWPILLKKVVGHQDKGLHLRPFVPRENNLYLISVGVGWAVLSWGAWSCAGRWVWRLKDYIDRRFIQLFNQL